MFEISATRAQRRLLQDWVILDIVRQNLVQMSQIDGQTEYLSQNLARIRSHRPRQTLVKRLTRSGIWPQTVEYFIGFNDI